MERRRSKLFMPLRFILQRYKQFTYHLIYPIYQHPSHLKCKNIKDWLIDLPFYFFDLFFMAEFYMLANLVFKKNLRRLNIQEKVLAESFYGRNILVDYIFIDNKSSFFAKKHNIAYVGFNLVNSWGPLRPEIFIHELMHVYQFQRFGSVYINRALRAQASKEAYDYGGAKELRKSMDKGKTLFDFNFEQQAMIIEHFYIISQREDLKGNENLWELYGHFYRQLDY